MGYGEFSDHDGLGKTGTLILTWSLRGLATRFQPYPLSPYLQRVFSGHPPGDSEGFGRVLGFAGVHSMFLKSDME